MRGLNPQHPPWQGGTLPIELIPQKLDSICLSGRGAPTRTESPGVGDRWFNQLTDTPILIWVERWGLNPRHQESQSCTLPTELRSTSLVLPEGIEPSSFGFSVQRSDLLSYRSIWRSGKDSNLRTGFSTRRQLSRLLV